MRIVLLAAALAASTALATPAFAQDADAPFTGPRVEGVVGWDRIDDGANSGTDASDGVVYGGQVGYDFQVGHAVLGFEGEATGSTNKDTTGSLITAGDRFRVSAGRDLYVGGRIGFVAGSRALIYAKGGYTNARINTRYTLGTATTNDHADAEGWRAGAGVEFSLSNNLYAKAEYRYSNYSNIDGTNADIDLDRHQVVAGLGFRF